ncbi:uncharacterized protein LOC118276789 isoform X2 [Spodoptera frugiperda]|nr:uncharacterized protein LOC118276789 isoform X2 [Spodoptera frugiperda]
MLREGMAIQVRHVHRRELKEYLPDSLLCREHTSPDTKHEPHRSAASASSGWNWSRPHAAWTCRTISRRSQRTSTTWGGELTCSGKAWQYRWKGAK